MIYIKICKVTEQHLDDVGIFPDTKTKQTKINNSLSAQ